MILYAKKVKSLVTKRLLVAWNQALNLRRRGSPTIGIASCDEWKNRVKDDLLLQNALIKRGNKVDIFSWQDKKAARKKYDLVIFASLWGYQRYAEDLYSWFEYLEKQGIRTLNSLDIVRRNIQKAQQIETLKRYHLPIIETHVIDTSESDLNKRVKEAVGFPCVIKPAFSSGGENTFLVRSAAELDEIGASLAKVNRRYQLLVQPFIREVSEGELSVVIIGGKIQYAVMRVLNVIDKERSYHVRKISLDKVSRSAKKICEKIIGMKENAGALYMRVDLVNVEGEYKIMELEMFEPQLFYYLLDKAKREQIFDIISKRIGV